VNARLGVPLMRAGFWASHVLFILCQTFLDAAFGARCCFWHGLSRCILEARSGRECNSPAAQEGN